MQDIIDLGDTEDLNLQMGAFGPPVQEQILKALSDNPLRKREAAKAGHGKQPREKIEAFRDKIVEYRRDTQLAEVESGTLNDRERKSLKPTSQGNNANVTNAEPVRNNECRICKEIQDQGNSQRYNLFEDHLGLFTYQCPVFMKMKMKDRVQVSRRPRCASTA